MSLEQKLENADFLEKTAVKTIEDAILYLNSYCKTHEQVNILNEHYQAAKEFLQEYNKCKLYGATPIFMKDLMSNMLFSSTGRIFKQSVLYLMGTAVSGCMSYLAYRAGNNPLMMVSAGLGLCSLVTSFMVPKCEYHETMLIYRAMVKHPEIVDKALKRLYEKEKNV